MPPVHKAGGSRARSIAGPLAGAALALGALIAAMAGISAWSTAADARTGDAEAPLAAFYGDSYTLGTGASDPAKRWSSILCAEYGWTEFNPSVNGLGFVNNRSSTPPDYLPGDEIPQIIARDPDLVIITMGLNDNFSMPDRADAIQSAIRIDFTTLATALPDARIVVVEPFWYTDDRPESVQTIIGWVEREARVIGADYVPDASHFIQGHPEWMASDGLHPNDDGYAELARRLRAAFAELDL